MAVPSQRLRPRKTPKQARARETQQRFLDAAARVFAEHGYSAGTTNRIAEAAGASVGSLYQYFPNKDAVLVALVRQHIAEGADLVGARLADTDPMPLADRLGVLVDAVLANHAGDPRLHQVLFEEAPRPPELLDELHALEDSVVAMAEAIIGADESVQVDDPAMAARLVVIAIESLIHRYISRQHHDLDLDSFRHELVAMLTRYLQGSSGSRRRPRPQGWMPDELVHVGRENLDPGHVARYDDKEHAGADAEVALLVGHGLDPTSQVVDLGAGTGQFTLAVAPVCARVVAVEVSPVMLDRLRAKVADAGVANVEVEHAGFLTYDHRGPPADVVYSRWALHHLPDTWKAMALARMRGLLEPGGLLRLTDIVYSFEPDQMAERVEQWCATLPAEADTPDAWVRADIEEHVRDEHSTFTWLLEPMIERSGFRIVESVHSSDGFFAEYVARAT